jgi:hypothetical protein
MTRLLLAAFAVAALASPALADDPHHDGPLHRQGPIHRMAPQQHPRHCTTRHHHVVCRR